ncbi:MAG: dihydropteroate synthase [Gammaproteobacteria bacterium RBG_16_57_12]|nr:MAG: dihydropteroate synthase [Gammaproteobacteria bacterium RBG_16_57_12]
MLICGKHRLDLATPQVMGILNITPDSFSDGGDFFTPAQALMRARQMAAEGAAIIDVGGESTRPGAAAVPVQQELDRVIPVIEAISRELPVVISIDTSKPEVMREASRAGAGMINDVYALRKEGAMKAAREAGVAVCLMHMQGEPRTMQQAPIYHDVVAEVKEFLQERIVACTSAGIPSERLVIDPGFGFGKNLAHNLALLRNLTAFTSLDVPLLIGLSRKSMIGQILNAEVQDRLYGSLALAALGAWQGAALVRAHDVKATVQVLQVVSRIKGMN